MLVMNDDVGKTWKGVMYEDGLGNLRDRDLGTQSQRGPGRDVGFHNSRGGQPRSKRFLIFRVSKIGTEVRTLLYYSRKVRYVPTYYSF